MRLQHPTDIATFTIEIAGIPGNLRFYGTTEEVAIVSNAIDAKGLIVGSVTRQDAMTLGRALEIINSIQITPATPPQPEFDSEIAEKSVDTKPN